MLLVLLLVLLMLVVLLLLLLVLLLVVLLLVTMTVASVPQHHPCFVTTLKSVQRLLLPLLLQLRALLESTLRLLPSH